MTAAERKVRERYPAPSYADLVKALRAWDADCAERISLYGQDFKALKPEQRHLHEQTRALLSRLPQQQEGTDR